MRLAYLVSLLVTVIPAIPIVSEGQPIQTYTEADAIRTGVPVLSVRTRWDDNVPGHHAECQDGIFHGVMGEGGSDWAGPFLIDTTRDFGGCEQQFVIRDTPQGPTLAGLRIFVEFGPNPGSPPAYCDNRGQLRREIPIVLDNSMAFTTPYRINTDYRSPSGCFQRFIVEGRTDIGLDIKFYGSPGGDPAQCGNGLTSNTWHTATVGKPIQLLLNTDDRPGACYQAFRLRFLSGPIQGAPLAQPIVSTTSQVVRAVDAANKGIPVMSAIVSATDIGYSQCPPTPGNSGNIYREIMGITDGNDWTGPFLISTDDSPGGCKIGFLIRDAVGGPSLVGLRIFLHFGPINPATGAGAGYATDICRNSGTHEIPIVAYGEFGSSNDGAFDQITINTDTTNGKGIGCRLLFDVQGRSDIGLDFQFYPEASADPGQCINSTGQGQWRTVSLGRPDGYTVLTDNRRGGCYMAFRLRSLGTSGNSSPPPSSIPPFSLAAGARCSINADCKSAKCRTYPPDGQSYCSGSTSSDFYNCPVPNQMGAINNAVPTPTVQGCDGIKYECLGTQGWAPLQASTYWQNQCKVPASNISVSLPLKPSVPTTGEFHKPANGAQARGIVPIEVKATNPAGVISVQIAVDGNTRFCKIEMHAPYTCSWDSRKVPNGQHTLTAVVKDKANKTMSVPPITVMVKN